MTRRIGFLLYPDITALDLAGPMEAFSAARIPIGPNKHRSCYEVVVVGLNQRAVKAESGLLLQAHTTLATTPSLDTLIIPGGRGLRDPRINLQVKSWVLREWRRFRRIASVCTGIYGLAPTGLLDGKTVTTHWAFAADVAKQFPRLKVKPDALYLQDGKFYTSAGITAGIDLALAMIEEDYGPGISLAVARELVVYLKRSGGQEQYSQPLQFQTGTAERFGDLAAWIDGNLHRPLSIPVLADRVHLGERHFSRQFKDSFGLTPARFIEHRRLDQARERLSIKRSSISGVAASVGFKSADAFRRAFERRFHVSPSHYRQRFCR